MPAAERPPPAPRARAAERVTTPLLEYVSRSGERGTAPPSCKWEHRANLNKGKQNKGGSRASSKGSNAPKRAPGSIDAPCKFHPLGTCRFGAQCPFQHDTLAAPAPASTGEGNPAAKKKTRSRSRKPKGGGNAPAIPAVALTAHGAAAALFDPQECGSKLDGSNHGPIR